MAKPFITWLGGKRRLLKNTLRPIIPAYGRYYEPFVGGGALLFDLEPKQAVIGDANPFLMAAYIGIKANAHGVAALLDSWPDNKEFFEQCKDRLLVDTDMATKAALFVYLNKTCFAGVWNCRKSDGRLSTPYDKTSYGLRPHRVKAAAELVRKAGDVLYNAQIRPGSWRDTLRDVQSGDLVFLDPPYLPTDTELKGDGYRGYTKGGFDLAEQEELAQWVSDAYDRGVNVIATNTDCAKARELYGRFDLGVHVTVRSCSSHSDQPAVGELVVKAIHK